MHSKVQCKNLNHGRMLVSIQHCPMCGEKFNTPTSVPHCSDSMHASRRKNRDTFCCDCGIKLIAPAPQGLRR